MALHATSVCDIGCKNEALKKLHLKCIIRCLKKRKYVSDQKYHILISPIDWYISINGEPDCLFNDDIQS